MSKVRKKGDDENEEEEDDDENQRVQIPDHLIRVLDGLAQEYVRVNCRVPGLAELAKPAGQGCPLGAFVP